MAITARLFLCSSIFSLFFHVGVYSQELVKLSGILIDVDTKMPVEAVSIVIRQLRKGFITDSTGRFIFYLATGKYELVTSFSGYHAQTISVDLTAAKDIRIEIKRKPPRELVEVVVESGTNANIKGAAMSKVNINLSQLRRNPNVFGEADIIKAVALQGGVTTVGEGAGGFNVRGGNTDQNLVLLDGAPLFNTSHLLGFYSTISPEAVSDATLFKGTLPAAYGGRLSSLLLMNVKQGNEEKIRYNLGISPISTRFFVDGPLKKNSLTFLAGGRIAYPKLMMNLFPGSVRKSNAFFYDGIAKLGFRINTNNTVSVTYYHAYDNFRFPGDTSYAWQSTIGSLSWKSQLSSRLVLHVNANHSKYISDINGLRSANEFTLRNDIQQQQGRLSLLYRLTEKNNLEVGTELTRYRIDPGSLQPTGNLSNIIHISLQKEFAREAAFYLDEEVEFFTFITLKAGVRFTHFENTGPMTIYRYAEDQPRSEETILDSSIYQKGKPIKNYDGLDPRLQLKFGIDPRTSIKLSYNRMRQFVHLVSNTIAITPIDYWKLSGPLIEPAMGDQFALGIFRNFANDKIETYVEGFYKKMNHLLEYKNGAQLSLNPFIESDLLPAKGKSFGFELMFRKVTGKYTGQLAYTFARSYVAVVTPFPIEEVNDGDYYPSQFDRPHNISLSGMIRLGKGWSFNYTFVFLTGRPATYPDGNYLIDSTVVANYSRRNADRLGNYHRMDLAFSFDSRRYSEQKKYSLLNFSLYNIYARKNPYSVYFKREGIGLYPYSLSILGTVIPSITWNYYF